MVLEVTHMSVLTRRFTEAGSLHLNIESLSPDHRNTRTDRDTRPIIHRSYQVNPKCQCNYRPYIY